MTDTQPTPNNNQPIEEKTVEEKTVDPRDLVNKGGYDKDPREIVEHPAVTPQMLDDRHNEGVGMDRVDAQDSN